MKCAHAAGRCAEPAEPLESNSMLSYCFEHGTEVENVRQRILSMTPKERRAAVLAARYDHETDVFKPIDAAADRAARAAERMRREQRG